MEYLLLIYEEESRFGGLNKEQYAEEMGDYRNFGQTFAGSIKGGNALQGTNTATTVRVRDGKRLSTDGPFAETKEQLGGYYLVDVPDLDAAIAMAEKIPGGSYGSIEIRPIMKFS
jgi:hypothetical protein